MARCELTGKGTTMGRRISINRSQVSKRAKRTVKPNIKTVRFDTTGGDFIKLNVSTSYIRTLKKKGIL